MILVGRIVDQVSETVAGSQPGLWERRKLEAMRRIQQVALDLFDERGYRNVTVERVAAEAAVSPSSIYRYFGTKEMLVLYDEYDPQILDLIRTSGGGAPTSPAELIRALCAAVPVFLDIVLPDGYDRQLRQRMEYIAAEPDIKAGMTRQTEDMERELRAILSERIGRDSNDLQVRLAAATGAWGFTATMFHWAESGYAQPLRTVLARAIELLARSVGAQFECD